MKKHLKKRRILLDLRDRRGQYVGIPITHRRRAMKRIKMYAIKNWEKHDPAVRKHSMAEWRRFVRSVPASLVKGWGDI